MGEQSIRGSEELMRAYRAGGFALEEGFINELVELAAEREIINVLVNGIPQPEFLHATFNTGNGPQTARFAEDVLALMGRTAIPGYVRLFPRGIPWPEQFAAQVVINERAQ